MTNLNLCAVDRKTGFCSKCAVYVRDASNCEELMDEFKKYDSNTGDYNWDEEGDTSFDIDEYLR